MTAGNAARVDLFGTEANTRTPDVNGCIWSAWFEAGWDSPEVRARALDPTGRHGTELPPSLYGGRPVTIAGSVKAPNMAAAWDAYEQVISSMPGLNETGAVVVHQHSTPRQLIVRQAGKNRAAEPRSNYFKFLLNLIAPMPFKLGTTERSQALTSGSTASLVNDGRHAAYPTVTLTSGGTVDLVIGTRHFTTAALPAGAVVDMWARTITAADGSSLYGTKTAASEWLALPPGSTLVGQDGTAALDLTWHDTYP